MDAIWKLSSSLSREMDIKFVTHSVLGSVVSSNARCEFCLSPGRSWREGEGLERCLNTRVIQGQ